MRCSSSCCTKASASFAATEPVELEVRERRLLAVIGRPDAIARTLAVIAAPPEVEPVVVLGNDSDRAAYGDYPTVSGLRAPLLAGLETSGRLTRAVKLSWRSLGIVRSARRHRRSGVTFDSRLAGSFDLFQHGCGLVVAGTDWPDDAAAGREWWRLVTTMRACRAIGHDVLRRRRGHPAGQRPSRRVPPAHRAPLQQARRRADLWLRRRLRVAARPAEVERVESFVDVLV